MAWPTPDTTIEDSEGYARESKARWLLGEDWSLGASRGERLAGGCGFLLRSDPRPWRTGG